MAGSAQRTGSASIRSRSPGSGSAVPSGHGDRPKAHDVGQDRDAERLLQARPGRTCRARPGRPSRARRPAPARGARRRSRTSACRPDRRGRAAGRVSGAIARGLGESRRIDRIGTHHLGPLRPLGVVHDDAHRRAEREPVADPPSTSTASCSKAIRAPAPVSQAPARQLQPDVVGGDRDPGGKPSMVAVRAGPWDSPAVSQRSTRTVSQIHAAKAAHAAACTALLIEKGKNGLRQKVTSGP